MNASPETLAHLIATRDLYFKLLLWSSGAVALGVVLEGPEVIHEARKALLHVHNETRRWITFVALLGWILVALGVLGEGISEALVSRAEGDIQSFNEQRLEDAMKQAGDAKSSAKDAADASDRAKASASDANEKTEEVKARVDAIRKRASDLEAELASVQHGLTLRLDRETVLVAKRDSFESAVEPFGGQKVDVRYAANLENPNNPYDPETLWFALQLSFSLQQAHWLSPSALRDVPAEHGTGVFIFVGAKSSKTTRDAALALADALVAVPVEVRPALKGSGLSPGSLVSVEPLPPRIPQDETALYPPLDDETIIVEVAPHP
jgi:hypothetical protein